MKNFVYIFLSVVSFSYSQDTIVLSTKKAFPGAFGAAELASGGYENGTPTFVEVTNLNESGAGSFRNALQDNTVVIVKVEGTVDLSAGGVSRIDASNIENLTIWGQFAPGNGLTISGESTQFTDCTNLIIRHMTFEKSSTSTSVLKIQETETTFDHPVGATNHAIYVDHVSARFGYDDQIADAITRHSTDKVTFANNLFAESGSTGGIFGDSGSAAANTGESTYARNMAYNISHRFPNVSGLTHYHQNYNNYIVNYSSRLIRTNGDVLVDYYNNYVEEGNVTPTSTVPTNKGGNPRTGLSIYAGFNYQTERGSIGDETPTDNQRTLWVYYKDDSNGTSSPDNELLPESFYVNSKQNAFSEPDNGVLAYTAVKDTITTYAGHNRGINADGTAGIFRDSLDTSYVTKALAGTTESTYRTSGNWNSVSSFSGESLYADTDGDFMPDWFENQHSHLDPNSSTDRDGTNTYWDFGSYVIQNNAGYTNIEMAAAYYAGDFDMVSNTAGYTVTPTSGLTTTEAGGTDTFDVVLDVQPTTDVVFDITSNDTGEGTVSSASLTFTNANWDTPQTITVTGVDDALNDGNQAYTVTVSVNDASSDNVFDALADVTVNLTNVDDDGGGEIIKARGGLIRTNLGLIKIKDN